MLILSWAPWAGLTGAAGRAAPKHGMVTVVGVLPHVLKGQMLRFEGAWDSHEKFGVQLRAARSEEVAPRSHEALTAYLAGSALPGARPPPCQLSPSLQRAGQAGGSTAQVRFAPRHDRGSTNAVWGVCWCWDRRVRGDNGVVGWCRAAWLQMTPWLLIFRFRYEVV